MSSPSSPRAIAFAGLLVVTIACHAEAPTYECVVSQVGEPAAPVSADVLSMERRLKAGATFTVVKKTGAMSGAFDNAAVNPPVVVNDGLDRNSYMAVTTVRRGEGRGPGSYVMTLIIAEYAKTPSKPFHFVEPIFSYRGTCTSTQGAP